MEAIRQGYSADYEAVVLDPLPDDLGRSPD